jgi:hypothetical protein
MIPSPGKTQVEESSETEGARSATGVTEAEAASRPVSPDTSRNRRYRPKPQRRAADRRKLRSRIPRRPLFGGG